MKIQAQRAISRLGRRSVKRIAEMLLAAALLCLSCPAMLLAMLAVRITSPGPALYFQERLGFRGRRIMICKIRTMTLNCERESGAVWSTPGDPRVTPIGRFLRRVHLDEVPQLVNVLRGDMSLVGPRPERPEIVAQIERALPNYRRRLEVRPGLTGLAQVLQPPDTDIGSVQRKLELDLQYMEQDSWLMDVKIMLVTPLHMINYPSRSIARFLQVSLDDLDAPASLTVSDSGAEAVHVQATYAS